MKLKILTQRFDPVEPKYTWNTDWINPFESAFCLLNKFALLNALGIESMAKLFVARKPRGQIASAYANGIPLMKLEQLNADNFCRLLQVSKSDMNNAFPFPNFDSQLIPFSDQLRYCRRCIKRGFHSVLHQMEMFDECPIHHTRLSVGCPHCGRMIPYKLTANTISKPFQCEHCEAPFSEELVRRRMDQLKFSSEKMIVFEELWQILKYDPEHPKWGRHVLDKKEFAWFDDFIAHASVRQRRVEYLHFLYAVDHHLHPEPQIRLSLYEGAVIELGVTIGSMRVACFENASIRDRHHLLKWRASNDLLWHLVPLYKSTCRYLWRHVVNEHQECIKTALNRIWWRVHLTPTKPICPVSFAFIRWRMFWEGHSAPRRLVEPASHLPYRLLAWLSDAAPFCPPTWPSHIRYWLVGRVLINDLLASFHQELDAANKLKQNSTAKWKWHRELVSGHNPTYWAVVESGDAPRQLRAFFEMGNSYNKFALTPFDATHLERHKESIKQVEC